MEADNKPVAKLPLPVDFDDDDFEKVVMQAKGKVAKEKSEEKAPEKKEQPKEKTAKKLKAKEKEKEKEPAKKTPKTAEKTKAPAKAAATSTPLKKLVAAPTASKKKTASQKTESFVSPKLAKEPPAAGDVPKVPAKQKKKAKTEAELDGDEEPKVAKKRKTAAESTPAKEYPAEVAKAVTKEAAKAVPVPKEAEEEPADGKKRKRAKREKKAKDPNAPKRPMNAYFHFITVARPKMRAKHPDMKLDEMNQTLKEIWATWKAAKEPNPQYVMFQERAAKQAKEYAIQKKIYEEKKAAEAAASAIPAPDDADGDEKMKEASEPEKEEDEEEEPEADEEPKQPEAEPDEASDKADTDEE